MARPKKDDSQRKSESLTIRCTKDLKDRLEALNRKYPEWDLTDIVSLCADTGERIESQLCETRKLLINQSIENQDINRTGTYSPIKLKNKTIVADDLGKANNDN